MGSILVVEDDEQVRVLAESILTDAGHEVISAGAPEAAKAALEAATKIDLLLTDVTLGVDTEAGLTLARYAVEKFPGIKVIYTTGQGVTDGMKVMFVEGSKLIAKPYRVEDLTEMVTACLSDNLPS